VNVGFNATIIRRWGGSWWARLWKPTRHVNLGEKFSIIVRIDGDYTNIQVQGYTDKDGKRTLTLDAGGATRYKLHK